MAAQNNAERLKFENEVRRIVDAGNSAGLTLRLLGSLAFHHHCPAYGHLQARMGRAYTDIDFAAYGPDLFAATIGPDKAVPQGALGNLLEYGSVHNPPHNDGGRALDAELPRFNAQMELLAARGLAWW